MIKNEEKGSDVNLAVHLVNDGWKDCYDAAIIISNDSDLEEALNDQANFFGKITKKILVNCQLPDTLPGTKIHNPAEWYSCYNSQ